MLPEQVDGYQVLRELGRGGMGVVYAVRDRAADRELALKLVHDLRDATALLRFRREGELLARVRHRCVVRVHSCGETSRGPYLLTDLVPGEPLSRRLAAGPLAPRVAALLVRDLADGVAACHASSLLHRDLKPANVLVRPEGTPVLVDFGLARETKAGGLTVTGELLGTPSHMAPEQGLGLPVDERVDVWGLGTVLYECLAGRPPFDGASPILVLERVCTSDPPWPSTLVRDVPPALEAIVRRAMARDPSARLPSAVALRDELDRWLAGFAAARPWPLLVAAVGLAALGLAGAVAWRGPAPGVVAPSPATVPAPPAPAPAGSGGGAPPTRPAAGPPARVDWSARILALERESRGFEFIESTEAIARIEVLHARWKGGQRLTREELETVRRYAERGHPDAQQLLALQLLPRDPRAALELLWAASRDPEPHSFAWWDLAHQLRVGAPELRDPEGARWLLAEQAARWARDGGNTDAAVIAALRSVELGTDADLGRALRIVRRPADPGRSPVREALGGRYREHDHPATPLLGLGLTEGWFGHLELEEGRRLLAEAAERPGGAHLLARWRALGARLCDARSHIDARIELALDAPAPRPPGP